jgi:hypothetical protein
MKRRQTVRRLEIIAIVVVVAVSLGVGFYLALTLKGPNTSLDNTLVPQNVYDSLYKTSEVPYGASGSAYMNVVENYTGPLFTTNGKPILVYVGAEFCPFCAVTRWPLIMALMRFGNFTNLEYMVSYEDNYATFTFVASSYHSDYLVFQPYEVESTEGTPLQTLPANYTSVWKQLTTVESFPFLDFNDQYVIVQSILPQPAILGTMNQTQIISSIQAGGSLADQIKQAANAVTKVICETTGNKPASVCGQTSITDTLVSYTPLSTSSGSELLLAGSSFTVSPNAFTAVRDYSSWN